MLLLFIYSFAIAIHLLIHGYQFPYLIHRQKEGGGYWCGRFDGFGAGVEMHDFGLAYLVVGDGGFRVEIHLMLFATVQSHFTCPLLLLLQ